jgi:DNA-directed RNA polymerases I, II, and III subunit RPABC2
MSYFDDDNDKFMDSDNDDKKSIDDEADEADDDDVADEEQTIIETEDEAVDDGDDDDDADDDENNVEEELETIVPIKKKKKDKIIKELPVKSYTYIDDDDDEEDDENETYLQKFDKDLNENYLVNFHPECIHQNYDEILALCSVVRNKDNIIIDNLHRTIPYLTKYERARILGQRAKQINSGATPFVKVPENVIDGYLIAELELKEKRIPFIIRRPLPNGGSEYWKVSDLENISF